MAKDLKSFFIPPHSCPDCGETEWYSCEDSGHDLCIECMGCHSRFGVQMPPFNMIERIE